MLCILESESILNYNLHLTKYWAIGEVTQDSLAIFSPSGCRFNRPKEPYIPTVGFYLGGGKIWGRGGIIPPFR